MSVEQFLSRSASPAAAAAAGPAWWRRAPGTADGAGRLLQHPLSALAQWPSRRPRPNWIGGGGGPGIGCGRAGQVNLRALPPLVVVEVLFGLQTRVPGGPRLTDVELRARVRRRCAASRSARSQDCETAAWLPASVHGRCWHALARRRPPARWPTRKSSRTRTRWDLAMFGHSRHAVVHRDHPALAGRGREAVGRRAICPGTAAAAPLGFAARSTASGCCRSTCGCDPIAGSTRRRWAGPTWRDSSTGWPTWKSTGQISRYRRNVHLPRRAGGAWPGSAPWG